MKSLAEHNEERRASHADRFNRPAGLDIACPDCESELMDDSHGIINASNPESIWGKCENGHRHVVVL